MSTTEEDEGGQVIDMVDLDVDIDPILGTVIDGAEELTLDDAITAVGIGWYHARTLLLCGSIFALAGMQVLIVTFGADGIRASFDLSDTVYSVVVSALFSGMFCGSMLCGYVSDKRGRRVAALASTSMVTFGGVVVCVTPTFVLLLVGYFILGVGYGGLHAPAALFVEILPTKHRLLGAILITSFFTTGLMLECAVASALQGYSWRWLIAVSLTPALVTVLFFPLWDESPRFLVLNHREDDAVGVLENIAAVNGHRGTLPPRFSLLAVVSAARVDVEPTIFSFASDFVKLFQHGYARLTLILFMVWVSASLGYFGLILIVGNLTFGSLSQFASTAVITSSEYPSYVALYILGTHMGRRRAFVVCSVLLAVLFPVIQALSAAPTWLQLLFMYVTRLVVTLLFNLAWVFTPEAYPTEVRSTGYGMCSATARVAGIVVPYIALPLYRVSPWSVTLGFGAVFGAACYVSSHLPFETKDRPLTDTLAHPTPST